MAFIKAFLQWLFRRLYRVSIKGLSNYKEAGDRVLIVANHASYLDGVLLAVFLPDRITFTVDSRIAKAWWVRPALALVDFFAIDTTNPLSTRSLIKFLSENRRVMIFPEGRLTVTGGLMKIYQGPGLLADKSQALVLPIRIDGTQHTPFTHLGSSIRHRWFPRITLSILPSRRISLPEQLRGRARRNRAATVLSDIMSEMMFATGNHHRPLFQALLDARRVHGGRHVIVEDIEHTSITYNQLISRAFILAKLFAQNTTPREYVGLLLPNTVATLIAFFALQLRGRVPAMLNFTAGAQGIMSACETAGIRTVYSSRRFIETARLGDSVAAMERHIGVICLEDLRAKITILDKLMGWFNGYFAGRLYRRLPDNTGPEDPAVVLFTSGSEGMPKAVVLSHHNLISNCHQIAARIDLSARDTVLSSLPVFHSFGLTAGTLLPLFWSVKIFLYPSPLHYRRIPETAYENNVTLLFGTNTFLAGYGRFAHPYDFYSARYVFAGAEKLQEETRRTWADKFGVRLLEGYGVTETGPVIAVNTPMQYRPGSVGRLLPGMECYIEPVPGINQGGRLCIRGPNVMLGYLRQGQITPAATERGAGWYDTGDIVHIDDDGFIWIMGRAKRFAKIAGEMVSLAAVEELVQRTWPRKHHAVFSFAEARKGEELIVLTDYSEARLQSLLERARAERVSAITVPKKILITRSIPLLGNGKVDYVAARILAQQILAGKAEQTTEQ
jgi:acyl-[acyl-carrier-protein]-phospholipid O-acyltransferase / long-chain-fatty-acid--[acyl-carrier-protein] ligase